MPIRYLCFGMHVAVAPKTIRNMIVFSLMIFCVLWAAASRAGETESHPDWLEWSDKFWPPRPTRGGIFRTAFPYYIGVFNPNHFPVMDWMSMTYFYEPLIYHDNTFKPTVPWLAESWEYLDQVTVLMKLRRGVTFHDGSPFNAESLKYQMEWIKNPDNNAWTRSWLEPLDSVEVIDAYTVKWHFKRPWGSFLGTMASAPGMAISAEALKKDAAMGKLKTLIFDRTREKRRSKQLLQAADGMADKDGEAYRNAKAEAKETQDRVQTLERRIRELETFTKDARSLDSRPVGTGQFTLDKASPGNYIQLKRNPNWWYGRSIGKPEMPYFDGVKVTVIPDPSVRLAGLKAGKLDSVDVKPSQYRLIVDDPRFNVGVLPLNALVCMLFNQARGPCKDIRVRKAISHAIDRKAIVEGTQFGLGKIASCIFPQNHWARNPALKPVTYDPAFSKKLLAEAGYADGLEIKGYVTNTPEAMAFAKAIMGMLKTVGVDWRVTFLSVTALMSKYQKLDYDFSGCLYPYIREPDHMVTSLYHPDGLLNNGRNRNEEVIALIEAGREAIDDADRIKIYNRLEKTLYDDYEDVWLFYPYMLFAASMNLRGIESIKAVRDGGEAYWFMNPRWFWKGKNDFSGRP